MNYNFYELLDALYELWCNPNAKNNRTHVFPIRLIDLNLRRMIVSTDRGELYSNIP